MSIFSAPTHAAMSDVDRENDTQVNDLDVAAEKDEIFSESDDSEDGNSICLRHSIAEQDVH